VTSAILAKGAQPGPFGWEEATTAIGFVLIGVLLALLIAVARWRIRRGRSPAGGSGSDGRTVLP
jgi:hypothetical protein